jgi:hypothetical protein
MTIKKGGVVGGVFAAMSIKASQSSASAYEMLCHLRSRDEIEGTLGKRSLWQK